MATEGTQSMKQINEKCIINRLPGDLIERVLLRLPVSTLLTCVGVCKHWHNIIRDPQFVALHLQCAPSYALVFFPPGLVSGKHYPSDAVLIDEAWSPSTYAVPVIGPDDSIFGSCNGLLGLYTKTSAIKIANLATGECLHLWKPAKNVKGDHFCFYSFGFHPVTKEYKITHFLGDCVNGRPHNKDRFNIIQVYTLGDEKWKDIRTPEALSLISVRNSGVVNVDGKMYWLTEDMLASWQHAVMSFDLEEESFAMIQLPAARQDHDYYGPRKFLIRDIDGKICIVTAQTSRYDARTLVGELQIWTLDNMVKQRWSQKYNIKHPPYYILGPHFVHRDRILAQHGSNNVCSYELLGENFEIDSSKMVKLLDFSARRHKSLQSHNCVKSLVRLDVYKNAEIVRRPKQQEGWELKKREAWEHVLSENEKLWSDIHRVELHGIACAQQNGIRFNDILQHILDDAIRREIGMKINQIFPNFPEQQPRPLRYLNCVAQKLDQDNLIARVNNSKTIIKAMMQTTNSILDMIDSAVADQKRASSSNAGISSQNHSEGDDAKT